MDWIGKKALVTGADGFIGSHLTEALVRAGAQVTALAQYNSFDSCGWLDDLPRDVMNAARIVRGDVRDAQQMAALCAGHEIVFHLAALIAVPYSYHAPASYVETNLLGTVNVLTGARAAGNARVVHTSTSEVYGTARFTPITEDHPVQGFADSDEGTLGLDPARLEAHLADIAEITDDGCRNVSTGRRIAAVVAMHAFGHPVDLDPLAGVCERFRLTLVEDAAGAIGSRYKGRHVGNHGRIAILSFNGNKTIATGGGGAILTNDDGLAAAAKHLTTTAKLPHRWAFEHDRVGFNYRLPNINAAMGCAQMERLAGFIENKRRLAAIYAEALGDVGGARIFAEPGFARSNYWLTRTCALPLAGANARLAEKRGLVTPSFRGTCTPNLLPVRLAHQILAIRPRRHFLGGAKWIRCERKRVVLGIRGDNLILEELVDLAESRSLTEIVLRALESSMCQMPNG